MAVKKSRTVKLSCPSLSKIFSFVALEEQRLDLGFIARSFGLDPSTVKINGHFISRGVDLVSSSVTWRSLLSFFSAKGLSTGKDDGDAIVVDGKLCKVGSKRSNEPRGAVNGASDRTGNGDVIVNRKSVPEDIDLLKNKKLRGSNSGCEARDLRAFIWNGFSCKRKQPLEDVKLLKRFKINYTSSDLQAQGNELPIAITSTRHTYTNQNMKRMREVEAILAAPSKKYR